MNLTWLRRIVKKNAGLFGKKEENHTFGVTGALHFSLTAEIAEKREIVVACHIIGQIWELKGVRQQSDMSGRAVVSVQTIPPLGEAATLKCAVEPPQTCRAPELNLRRP